MSTRRWYAAGLGAVVLLALGACSADGDDPGKSPSSSSSSTSSTSTGAPTTGSPTTTATVSPADLPPEARKHTPEGAAAFVKFFVEQTNIASRTADTSIIPPLTDEGCKSCAALQEQVQSLRSQQRHYKSDPATNIKTDAVPGGAKGQQLVRLRMAQTGAAIVDKSGAVVDTDPREDVARTVSVVWRGNSWVVYGIA